MNEAVECDLRNAMQDVWEDLVKRLVFVEAEAGQPADLGARFVPVLDLWYRAGSGDDQA